MSPLYELLPVLPVTLSGGSNTGYEIRKNEVISELPRKVDEEFSQRGLVGYLPKEDIGTQSEENGRGNIVRSKSLHGSYKNLSVIEIVMFPRKGLGKSWGNFILRPKDSVRVYGGVDLEAGLGSNYCAFTENMLQEKNLGCWHRIRYERDDEVEGDHYHIEGLYPMASVDLEGSRDFMGAVAGKVVDLTDFQRRMVKTSEIASERLTREQRADQNKAMAAYRTVYESL